MTQHTYVTNSLPKIQGRSLPSKKKKGKRDVAPLFPMKKGNCQKSGKKKGSQDVRSRHPPGEKIWEKERKKGS